MALVKVEAAAIPAIRPDVNAFLFILVTFIYLLGPVNYPLIECQLIEAFRCPVFHYNTDQLTPFILEAI